MPMNMTGNLVRLQIMLRMHVTSCRPYIHIAILLSTFVVHCCFTDILEFSRPTFLPIHKGRSLHYSDSTNYRGISVSAIIGKLFDNFIQINQTINLFQSTTSIEKLN